MGLLLWRSLEMWRRMAGRHTAVERFLKRQYLSINGIIDKKIAKRYSGADFIIFWSGSPQANRIGIYMIGSCDLPSIFTAIPSIQPILNGTCCMFKEGLVSDVRSDLLLQSLQEWPQELIAPTLEKLKRSSDQFHSRLFEKSFIVQGSKGLEEFSKDVIILSIAADVTRSIYQHREHGFLIDPGSGWLRQAGIGEFLKDLSAATWLKENFVSLGRISVEAFFENFTRIIKLIKEQMDTHILILNVFTVEPSNPTYNYQFVRNPLTLRRREFNLALVELSKQLDFSIVDVDRILKKVGLPETQVDFAHFPLEIHPLVAQEAFRIMRELEVF